MKRLILVASIALVALASPLWAVAQPAHHADSPKAALYVADDLAVGTVVLPAGQYRIQCRTINGKTFLVIIVPDTGKEAARVPCQPGAFDGKINDTQYGTQKDPAGKRTLSWVRIKGETSQHNVVIN
jgi:hypothetical protein